jgi:uncharacterized membrane protein (UPF0127 family)
MLFHLDLLFLDLAGRVIDIRRNVPSTRFVRCRAADAVLELPSRSGQVVVWGGSSGVNP